MAATSLLEHMLHLPLPLPDCCVLQLRFYLHTKFEISLNFSHTAYSTGQLGTQSLLSQPCLGTLILNRNLQIFIFRVAVKPHFCRRTSRHIAQESTHTIDRTRSTATDNSPEYPPGPTCRSPAVSLMSGLPRESKPPLEGRSLVIFQLPSSAIRIAT